MLAVLVYVRGLMRCAGICGKVGEEVVVLMRCRLC